MTVRIFHTRLPFVSSERLPAGRARKWRGAAGEWNSSGPLVRLLLKMVGRAIAVAEACDEGMILAP